MRKIFVALAALVALATSALAQSSPGLRQGDVPTAAQWNSYFAAKQDYIGTPLTASTLVGIPPITIIPSGGISQVACSIFTDIAAGCVPPSGGGTTHFLRADGTWADPTGVCSIFDASNSGCVPGSGGGTTNFLRADGTWAAPPAPSTTLTIGSNVVSGGANRTLYDNNGVLGAGPVVIPTAFTRLALQTAVSAVCSAGGGTVQLLDGDYIYSAGNSPVTISCSNIRIQGTPKSRLVAPADSTSISGLILWTASSAINTTTVASNAAIGDLTVTLASGSGYGTGDYIFIQNTTAAGYFYTLLTKVVSVAGNVVTISDPMPFAVTVASDTTVVQELEMRSNIQIDNIQFIGTGNSGTTRGILSTSCVECSLTNLKAFDFSAGAFYFGYGYGNVINNIQVTNSGTAGESDITFIAQTAAQIDKISSIQASGFGPQFVGCSYMQVGMVNSHKSAGRGIKLNSVRFSTFQTLIGNNSGSTGIGITLGSSDNQFGELIAIKNIQSAGGNAMGVWFSGQNNERNTINSIRAYKNADFDIILFSTDNNNIIVAAQYATISNGGTNNSIVTSKVTTP